MIGVEFTSCAIRGDIIEIGMETVKMETTSMTIRCDVKNKHTEEKLQRTKLLFLNIGDDGTPKANKKV